MNKRAQAGALCLALSALIPFASFAASATPLLDYAQELSFATAPNEVRLRENLEEAKHEVERFPAPETDCARTLGASRFAMMYDQLGISRSGLGDYAGAADAFTKALTCTPRSSKLIARLAGELAHQGQYVEARETAERGLTIDSDDPSLSSLLAQIDFIEERWADAVARLRVVAMDERDDDRAAYWQCFLWLAQKRAGVERPELVEREPPTDWPREILDTLTGELTEEQLLEAVKDEDMDSLQRENLAEALYYMGQLRLAEGRAEEARRYFAATVNLKVLYFIEHHMARAELAKMLAQEQRAAALRP